MNISKYSPEHYRQIHLIRGERLWKVLTHRDMLVRMETASFLRRPAAEVAAPTLLDEFGDDARDFHFRQYVGHMIRHIMEQRGYVVEQSDVRIPRGKLFTRAARYRKDDDHGSSKPSD